MKQKVNYRTEEAVKLRIARKIIEQSTGEDGNPTNRHTEQQLQRANNRYGRCRSARETDQFGGDGKVKHSRRYSMKEPWIQTYTGKQFSYLECCASQINITDIARALSHICRFTGHCKSFYSVAQHSVLVSENTRNPFYGLMHDAAEAYVGDMNRPLKHLLGDGVYRETDDRVWSAIADKWPLLKEASRDDIADCKNADMRMLVTESHDLLRNGPHPDWRINQETHPRYDFKIEPLLPDKAMEIFLNRFLYLAAWPANGVWGARCVAP